VRGARWLPLAMHGADELEPDAPATAYKPCHKQVTLAAGAPRPVLVTMQRDSSTPLRTTTTCHLFVVCRVGHDCTLHEFSEYVNLACIGYNRSKIARAEVLQAFQPPNQPGSPALER
jgi:hypothetical protein